MPYVIADDGAQIFYKDWGTGGSPVILSHGWPLNADAWDAAALFLAEHGHRVDRARPARPRPVEPDLARQRDGHLRRRPGVPHRRTST